MDNNTPKDIEKYGNNYSDEGLWSKIAKVAGSAGKKVLWYVLVLYYVLQESSVPLGVKATIIGALGYFILPVDLIPDFIPVAGYTDDLGALVFAYKTAEPYATPEIRQRAEAKLKEWFD